MEPTASLPPPPPHLRRPGLAQPHEYDGFDACIAVVVRFYNRLNDSVKVAGQTQRQAKAGWSRWASSCFPNITARVTIAGGGGSLATAHGVAAIAAPPIQLASMGALPAPPLGPAINPACGGLFGPSCAPPIPPKFAAALISAASTAADPPPRAGHTS
jgi:hypothetical protein